MIRLTCPSFSDQTLKGPFSHKHQEIASLKRQSHEKKSLLMIWNFVVLKISENFLFTNSSPEKKTWSRLTNYFAFSEQNRIVSELKFERFSNKILQKCDEYQGDKVYEVVWKCFIFARMTSDLFLQQAVDK